jgi:hypothetical protein
MLEVTRSFGPERVNKRAAEIIILNTFEIYVYIPLLRLFWPCFEIQIMDINIIFIPWSPRSMYFNFTRNSDNPPHYFFRKMGRESV